MTTADSPPKRAVVAVDVPLLLIALASLAGTLAYLSAGGMRNVLIGGTLAALVLLVPLMWSAPANRSTRGRVALIWAIGGVIGGYGYGVLVLAAAAPAVLLSLAARGGASVRSAGLVVLAGLSAAGSVLLFIVVVGGPTDDPLLSTLYWCGLPLLAWGGCGYLSQRMGHKAFAIAVWIGGIGTAALVALPVAFSLSLGRSDL